MKNSQSIRKVLFISKKNIALVVFEKIQNENVILFASQLSLQSAELIVQLRNIFTTATNFLGFAVDEVEVVIDDYEMVKIPHVNVEFPDCNNEDEIAKEIYKNAKVEDKYVNEINFGNTIYDDIEKKAIVNYEIIGSDYQMYKKSLKVIQECRVKITNVTNLYSLLNNKAASSQVIIKMINGSTIVSEYKLAKLDKVTNVELQTNEIYTNLANRFNVEFNDIKQMLTLANKIEATVESETIIYSSFDPIHRRFSSVKAGELVQAYQDEVSYLLSTQFKLNDFSEVTIITNEPINKLAIAKIEKIDEIIGLEEIDFDKLVALNKIDTNGKANSHFKFENSLNRKIHSIAA